MEDNASTNSSALPGFAKEDAADAAPASVADAADATDGEHPVQAETGANTGSDSRPGVAEMAVQVVTGEEEVVEEVPEQKFQVRQRVFARDEKASGILYE